MSEAWMLFDHSRGCHECGCTMHLSDTGEVPLYECTFCGNSVGVPSYSIINDAIMIAEEDSEHG